MQHPFVLYSSSAGSGKTYTLTKSYLALALQPDNAGYFKQILAITFTNDAANEMKERILSALKGFADETSLPESKQLANRLLLQAVVQEINQYNDGKPVTEAELRRRATRTFRTILHDYSDFSVSTIDSFVNRLVGAFTEELDIPFNYEVDLDATDLLNNAIDRLLDRIGAEEEVLLSETLASYALEKADEGHSWSNLPGDLAYFGKQLLSDRVFDAVSRLQTLTLSDFQEIRGQMDQARELLRGQVASLADEALQYMESNGLDSSCFSNGTRGIFGYFANIAEDVDSRLAWEPTASLLSLLDESDWAPKKLKEAQRVRVNGLQAILRNYFTIIERLKGEYMLINAILRHFYKLSVIHEISRELDSIKAEKNVVHISDFNKAIIGIVLREPVPFIYERLGERYNHILIDEFQDTSTLQWNNLLPLVENGVAKGHFSLVVGDAKQAIYGWRGGDMEQIVHLSQQRFSSLIGRHTQTELLTNRYETLQYALRTERLTTNYRSVCEIVAFNNALFRTLTRLYQPDKQLLGDVYDIFFEQQAAPNARTGGHVQLSFIDPTEMPGEDVPVYLKTYEFRTLQAMLEHIREAREAGYALRDIAVLCRANRNGKLVANFLRDNQIGVISQDSLLLQSAESVQLLLAFFLVIRSPESPLYRYQVLHQVHAYMLGSLPDAAGTEIKQLLTGESVQPLYDYLAAQGYALDSITLPLGMYELTEKLIGRFSLFEKPRQAAYLFRFLDVVLEFSVKQSNHLADFLEYWENKRESLCINTPKDWDAVTVNSIHKAKGLEYPVVIVPFADWEFSHQNHDLLWMSLENETLSQPVKLLQESLLRSAVISPKKDLGRTPLQTQYSYESEKLFIENLNALYVALTRPTDRLYLLSKQGKFEKSKAVTVSHLLYQYLDYMQLWEAERPSYTLHAGKPKPTIAREESTTQTVWLNEITSTDWQTKARLRRSAEAMFDPETFDKQKDLPRKLREALCRMKTSEDLPTVLQNLQTEGLLDELDMLPATEALNEILQLPVVQVCFANDMRRLPHRDILCSQTLRLQPPDRVVTDGNTITILKYVANPPTETDRRSLNRYAQLLHQMGYSAVEKILVCTQDRTAEKW